MRSLSQYLSHEDYVEDFQDSRIIDDMFMSVVFNNDIECAQVLLNVILGRKDLKVLSSKTQVSFKNLYGRSTVIDVLAKDSEGALYDIEFQRDPEGASPLRARYHSSIMDSNMLKSGQSYKELAESYVIFICEKDVFGKGLPIYTIEEIIKETGMAFADKRHILYVNGENRTDTELGILIQDLYREKAKDIKTKVLSDKVRQLKEKMEGKNMPSKIKEAFERALKDEREEAEHDKSVELARNFLAEEIPVETIAKCTGLPLEEVEALAKEVG
ncbi:MAG: Rpn family recombination-promoting nuclease/putative transposase [Lachnospiraceae bacterium]|nr:Rpn family recombination-promoting nuclease/putative transposase [Lachnospiraceae bacterium]